MAQFLQKKKKKQVLHLKKKAKVKSKDGKITLPGEQKQPRGKEHVLSPSFMGFPIMKKAPGPPQRCGDRDRDRSCHQRGRGGSAALLAAARGWPSLTGCRNLGLLPTPDKSLLFACSGFDAVIASSEPALERKRKGKEKEERGRRAACNPGAAKAGRILPGDPPAPGLGSGPPRSWEEGRGRGRVVAGMGGEELGVQRASRIPNTQGTPPG